MTCARSWMTMLLVGCSSAPPATPSREPTSAGSSASVAEAAPAPAPADRVENIEALGMRIRLPASMTLYEVNPEPGLLGPGITLIFTGGSDELFAFRAVAVPGRDPLTEQRKYVREGAKRTARVLVDEADVLLIENTNDLIGDHCEVTACSSTTPRYCAEAVSGSTYKGKIHKLTMDECKQVVEIARSIELVPAGGP